ncbi:hypothetical protein PVAND_014676 [Polypedilum vanderplanki]|uniref:C2H2-type domain-containing protein n=1 Tax=Polypedilum vanderplanki TaxID=319348 RepID=A0A9J6BAE3_POLVA|nr:hypothetical protein PVAND_014676 [Polypedilum vanderplanki]
MASDFNQWCRLCSAIETELVTDVNQLLFIENTFSVPILEIMICSTCKTKIIAILDLIETSHYINQMYLDLQTFENEDLSSEMLNEIRSNYGLESISTDSYFDDSGMSFCSINGSIFEMNNKIQEKSKNAAENLSNESFELKNLKKQKKLFICKFCGKIFNYKSVLNYHESIHENALDLRQKFTCDFDGSKFTTKGKLLQHMREKHLKNSEFICFCGKIFYSKIRLKDHLKDIHGNLNFKCNFCDFSTTTEQKLKIHYKTKHKNKNFICEICFKNFKCEKYLKSHKITHEERKNYQCNVENCSKKFKRLRELKAHWNLHTKSKLYNCEFCPLTFTDSANRNKHAIKIHPTNVNHMIATYGSKWRKNKEKIFY